MKTIVFAMEVPEYWDANDINGVPVDENGYEVFNKDSDKIDMYEGGVGSMLSETLVFCEKKYNKRIDGEGVASGMIISENYDLKKLKAFVKHLEGNGGSLYHV